MQAQRDAVAIAPRKQERGPQLFAHLIYWRNVSAFAVRFMADTISFAQHNVRFTLRADISATGGHLRSQLS
jgi:hypothetical protein